jgi:tetratricopeptide (TPR) repeat protein
MSRQIEKAISRENWKAARRLISAGLRKDPDNHWLLTRLSLTYYEERRYTRALAYSERALAIAPRCPLALWDHAGTLEMLGCVEESADHYRRLIRCGVRALAFGDCGEGVRWARGLVADCWYRLGQCESKLGRKKHAVRCLRRHLSLRGPGCRSIYPLRTARRELETLTAVSNPLNRTRSG